MSQGGSRRVRACAAMTWARWWWHRSGAPRTCRSCGSKGARRAAKGAYLWADLLGLHAETPEGQPLGDVREVLRAGETDVLVIRPVSGADLLVPAIASVVREVDVAAGRVVIVPQETFE